MVRRSERWSGLPVERQVVFIADDLDTMERHTTAHDLADDKRFGDVRDEFQAFRVNQLRAQNRMLFAVVIALIGVMASLAIPLLTR